MMLKIHLFGHVTAQLSGVRLAGFSTKKELAVLAYLAHTGKEHSREALADLFWEARTTKQSLSNLRTLLTRLRKQVGDHLIITRKTVKIAPEVHQQTDSTQLRHALATLNQVRTMGDSAALSLSQTLALYTGEFMAGLSLSGASRFEEWRLLEQEQLRRMAMIGYRQLTGWQEKQGLYHNGIPTAEAWVAADPLDETAQQQLMRMLAYGGRANDARQVYQACRQLLRVELDIEPATTTTALFESIQKGELRVPPLQPSTLHNLPRAYTELFGRNEEIDRLIPLLQNPALPLVAITGVGGIGKTTLALATARKLIQDKPGAFRDGVWFIPLDSITNAPVAQVKDNVALRIGQALGIYFHGSRDNWDQLLGQLARKQLLLIIDNIEQFQSIATDLITELLSASEHINIVATSRTMIASSQATPFPLSGLETPTSHLDQTAALQNVSIRLFASRAKRVPTPFRLQKDWKKAVEICQFLAGSPLGIELVTASLGRLMIDEIMPALRENVALLDSAVAELPSRQHTLQAVFNYTWQLLEPAEQIILAQLTVFHDGFTKQAFDAIIPNANTYLYTLQHHALITRLENGRFHMKPLLRQFAESRLNHPTLSQTKQETEQQHSRYFGQFISQFAAQLEQREAEDSLNQITSDQANLQAAWRYAVETADWPLLAQALNGYHYFYKRRGFYREEARLVDTALNKLKTSPQTEEALTSRLLTIRAKGYLNAADLEQGENSAQQACTLAQKLNDPQLEAQARLAWAENLYAQSKHDLARDQYEKVIALTQTAGNQILEADGWFGMGSHVLWQVDAKAAETPLKHALELSQRLGYQTGEMNVLTALGISAMRQEQFAPCVAYYEAALALSRLLNDVVKEAELLGNLGVVARYQDDLVGSQTYHEESLVAFTQLNMPGREQWLLGELGVTAIRLGNYKKAETQLAGALTIAERINDRFWGAWVKGRMGTLWVEQGAFTQAETLLQEAHQTAVQLKNPRLQGMVLYDWGTLCLGREEWGLAEEKFQHAYDLWTSVQQTGQASPSIAGLAYATYRQNRPGQAIKHAEALWQIWAETPKLAARASISLYWMLATVWEGVNDERATAVWEDGRALVQRRADTIKDDANRHMFLHNIPMHRAILSPDLRHNVPSSQSL